MANYTYTTMIREDNTPLFRYAELKNGRIVSINEHWVTLEQFRQFFESDAEFIDITDIFIDGHRPEVGDIVQKDILGTHFVHSSLNWSIQEAKENAIERIKLQRNVKELEPISYKNVLFDADKDAIMRMDMAQRTLELTNPTSTILWTAFDNSHIELNVSDFAYITVAMTVRSSELHNKYGVYKAFIQNIDTMLDKPEQYDNEVCQKVQNDFDYWVSQEVLSRISLDSDLKQVEKKISDAKQNFEINFELESIELLLADNDLADREELEKRKAILGLTKERNTLNPNSYEYALIDYDIQMIENAGNEGVIEQLSVKRRIVELEMEIDRTRDNEEKVNELLEQLETLKQSL